MDLFGEPELPPGFAYEREFLRPEEERSLADRLAALPFKAFEFRGFVGRRRVVSFGWHRDRPEFGDVVGISLLSSCAFRLRRRHGGGWNRITIPLAPRSAYHLTGEARTIWEHSIPGLPALRYSITFRNLKSEPHDRLKA